MSWDFYHKLKFQSEKIAEHAYALLRGGGAMVGERGVHGGLAPGAFFLTLKHILQEFNY